MSMIRNARLALRLAVASLLVSGAVAGAQAPVNEAPTTPATEPGFGFRPHFLFGVRTGAAVAKLVSDQQGISQGRYTPTTGLFTEARFGRWVSLVLDAQYTQYGGNGVSPTTVYGGDSLAGHKVERMNVQTHAIEVPLQLRLRPSVSGSVVPYLSGGISKAWFLGTVSDNYVLTSDSALVEIGVNMDPAIHPYDWAGLGAIGVEVHNPRMRWSVELFSRFGVTEFSRSRMPGVSGYTATATGLKFGFGR